MRAHIATRPARVALGVHGDDATAAVEGRIADEGPGEYIEEGRPRRARGVVQGA